MRTFYLARSGAGVSVVLAPQDIEAFGGSTAAFAEWLAQYLS